MIGWGGRIYEMTLKVRRFSYPRCLYRHTELNQLEYENLLKIFTT